METEEAQEMTQMPGKTQPPDFDATNACNRHNSQLEQKKKFLIGVSYEWQHVSAGRDSPDGNGATEEAEEPMAVPEDLSANSIHQQNNRADKGRRQHHGKQTLHPIDTDFTEEISDYYIGLS